MITCAQLAETLKSVNVAELARHTGIAEKTIYRLRNQSNDPSLGTVEKLLAGIERIKAEASARAMAEASPEDPRQCDLGPAARGHAAVQEGQG